MKEDTDDQLDRDQQILSRLAKIEHKVDSLDQTTAFSLRADAEKHSAEVMKIFGRSRRKAQVYLAVNGARGVQEIASHLKMKRQNVGTELRTLSEEGLIEIIDTQGGKDIWGKKPIDRTLRITRLLLDEFAVGSDGQPRVEGAKRSQVRRRNKR